MTEKNIRIGAVAYLNTKPLVYRLPELVNDAALAKPVELIFDLPSKLADQLESNKLDIALIPSIETLQSDCYVIVSDACIACNGPVWSVRLLSRVPLDQVRSIAIDEGSRTSIALTKILFDLRFGYQPEMQPLPIDQNPIATETDAVLIIGDRAMQKCPPEFSFDWDLGEEWKLVTGLPFVFAMWTARRDLDIGDLGFYLSQARDRGVAHAESIAREFAHDYGLTEADCVRYFQKHLQFELAQPQIDALSLFRQHAARLQLIPADVELQLSETK